jgi:hypothetical protein
MLDEVDAQGFGRSDRGNGDTNRMDIDGDKLGDEEVQEIQTAFMLVLSSTMQLEFTYVYLLISERYCSGVVLPVENDTIALMNLPGLC